jgi:erythronate-4-phosphate dehydrogenase
MVKKNIKIIADDKIPFLKGVLEQYAEIEYYPGAEISNRLVKDADALLIRTRTKCNCELLENSKVKIIATATIGYDHIDTVYCDANDIKWINAPGCNSTSVMQYIASALLYFAQSQKFYLQDKTLGIVGVGNVGRKVQKLAKIFGMDVLLNDPPRERKEGSSDFCSLDELMKNSDIITFHVPLNYKGIDKTFHLADEGFFNSLSKEPIIINTSRGEVIKSESLKFAIKSGKIKGAALDVWENEPFIDSELLRSVNLATPHIAGYSADGKANGTSVCVNEMNKFFDLGLPLNWYPENVPLPSNGNQLTVNGKNKYDQEIFSEVINYTYDVRTDHRALISNPEDFELLRGGYPIRREFNSFEIKLVHCHSMLIDKLIKLNFNIKCN